MHARKLEIFLRFVTLTTGPQLDVAFVSAFLPCVVSESFTSPQKCYQAKQIKTHDGKVYNLEMRYHSMGNQFA